MIKQKIKDFKKLEGVDVYRKQCHLLLDECELEIRKLEITLKEVSNLLFELLDDPEINLKTKQELIKFANILNINCTIKSDEEQ